MPQIPAEDNWLSLLKKKNRDSFSELDVLLRALDRFFDIDNLPFSRDDLTGKNFFSELTAARDVIIKIVDLLESIIPDNRKNIYRFHKFAQDKLLTTKKRDALKIDLYRQERPEKSLLLLYDFFLNAKGIAGDIIKSEHISYLTFTNVGHLVEKGLRENIYFNPFSRELNPDYDIIENPEISKIVKGIKEQKIKKGVSVMLLHLFKFLRYLKHVDASYKSGYLNPALLIILLLRSEINSLKSYIDKIAPDIPDEGLQMLMRAFFYQFSIESKRVYQFELREIFTSRTQQNLKGRVENSHGILKNLTEQSVVQIAQFFDPSIKGNMIFDSFVTKLEQSLKLREDILVLHRFLTLMGYASAKRDKEHVSDAMKNYMLYFQSLTFRLLRHDDYEEFASFFNKVLTLDKSELTGKNFDKLIEKIKQFRIFLETTLGQISNRGELNGRVPDMERVENTLNQYLK